MAAAGATGVGASVAGCFGGGGDGDLPEGAESGDTVVKWNGGVGDGEGEEFKKKVRQALHDSGLPDDIFVQIIDTPETTDETLDQYRTWLSAGREEPDMFSMDSGWTIPFIQRGQLQNIEELLDSNTVSTIKNDFFEASVASASKPDGTLYGVPEFPDFPTMQYRKDWVEDAGYDTSDWQSNPLSWERFAEITADVTEQQDAKFGYTFQADAYEGLSCCDYNEWMTTWGGAYFGGFDNLFGPVGDRPVTVNEGGAVEAIRMVRAFIHGTDADNTMDITGSIAPSATLGWTEETSRKPFTNGNAVMHRNWPYSIAINGADEEMGENLGVMPLPFGVEESEAQFNGTGGTASALGGWNTTFNPNSEKTDAIIEVIKAKMSDDFMLWQFKEAGLLPAKPKLLEAGGPASDLPVMGRYLDAIRMAGENAIPRPVTVVWPDQSGAIASAVNEALQKNAKSPQKKMDELAQRLEDIEQSA